MVPNRFPMKRIHWHERWVGTLHKTGTRDGASNSLPMLPSKKGPTASEEGLYLDAGKKGESPNVRNGRQSKWGKKHDPGKSDIELGVCTHGSFSLLWKMSSAFTGRQEREDGSSGEWGKPWRKQKQLRRELPAMKPRKNFMAFSPDGVCVESPFRDFISKSEIQSRCNSG